MQVIVYHVYYIPTPVLKFMHVFLLSNSQSKLQAIWMDTHLAITKDSVYTLGLCLMCSKLLPIILLEFPRTFTYYILLCLAYYSKIILRRYTCIRNTSFKIVESCEVKSLVLAANRKQGTI